MPRFDLVPAPAAIIDGAALKARLAALAESLAGEPERRHAATELARQALAQGRAEIGRRMRARPGAGREFAASTTLLADELLGLFHAFAVECLYPRPNPTKGERLALVALGGYGRGELAPHSDLDLMFLTPGRPTGWSEQVIESILYSLWDLGLKVGHAVRTPDEVVRVARTDLTIQTALLEARPLCGDQPLAEEALGRFRREVVAGGASAFITAKLAERSARHERMGDSRYVVEPNLKEGKGGLRDLHTLFWIGKYVHQTNSLDDLVSEGLLTAAELRQFKRAEDFFWAVRCNLHDLAGRAEERLTFDVQPEIARRLRYAERRGQSAVERFMRHYFLHARHVGALTGVFLTQIEERQEARPWLPRFTRRPKALGGFTLRRGRLGIPSADFFARDPVRLIELFALANARGLEVDPIAMRQATRDASMIDESVRQDSRANALFLDMLTSPRQPDLALKLMNETGVFGRFLPDFGRIVAQMQFDMYHHYTVDEHTIRAIGILSRIESGELAAEYRLAASIVHQLSSRRALYVAVLLHDIAKGRGGDHSEIGAEIALALGPRFGLSAAETETAAWLVRHHLRMSATAFKRDLTDPKTISDFVDVVQSPERLRLLLVLTTVDISAVGPGVWTGWKGQLLRDLFDAAEEVLRLGHKQHGRAEQVAAKQERLGQALGWSEDRLRAHAVRFADAYWLAEPADVLESNARLVEGFGKEAGKPAISADVDARSGATMVSVYAPDEPGLFSRVAGAIALGGASIADARIHTTHDGMALDNFIVQDPLGAPLTEARQLQRVKAAIRDVLAGEVALSATLAARPLARPRAEAFGGAPDVHVSNRLSNRFTVAEVNALDRPALLYALTSALFDAEVAIHSAHIATFGERAIDVFYLTDLSGAKIIEEARLRALERLLCEAARSGSAAQPAAA